MLKIMKKIKFLLITLILLNFSSLKAAEAIVGNVEGMFCIECQKKLAKAFQDEFGSDAKITVSWEKGLGVVSVPSNGKITEADFKRVVEKVGFKYGQIKKTSSAINNLDEANLFIDKNPGFLTIKTF